jgi:hypothetical protein
VPPIQVRLERDGAASCRTSNGAAFAAASPSALWQRLADGPAGAFHLLPEGTEPTGGSGSAAEAMMAAGCGAAVGPVLRAGGVEAPAPWRTDAVRSARMAGGGLIVSAGLSADLAARLVGRRWDRFWPSDLAALVAELCEPLRWPKAVARRLQGDPDEDLRGDLLPPWRAGLAPHDGVAPTLLVYGACDASSMLYFDAFARTAGVNLLFLRPSHPAADLGWLCAASAVVLVRGLAQALQTGMADLMRAVGVPVFWFVDDDFFALAREYPSFAPYKAERMADLTERIAGIIVPTAALRETLAGTIGFPSGRIAVLGPRPARCWPRPTRPAQGVGLIGGTFRGEGLRRLVVPALAASASPPRIVACDNLRPFLGGIQAEWEPYEPDFLTFLHRWQRRAPAVIAHPPGRTANLPAKSDATILVAHAIGTVPVVADEPGFSGWGEEQGVVRVAGRDWAEALRHAQRPDVAGEMRARLDAVLAAEARFSDDALTLLAAVAHPAPVADDLFHERLNAALGSPLLAPRVAEPRVRRSLAKRLRDSAVKRLGWLQ